MNERTDYGTSLGHLGHRPGPARRLAGLAGLAGAAGAATQLAYPRRRETRRLGRGILRLEAAAQGAMVLTAIQSLRETSQPPPLRTRRWGEALGGMMKCKDCGGEMSPNSTGGHLVWATCFGVVKARADAAEARVAELETALAAERAANTWRPVTADWPPRNQRVVISAPGASWADVARKQHDGEEYVWQLKNGHVLDFESATVAIPLPPAPDAQEPTP